MRAAWVLMATFAAAASCSPEDDGGTTVARRTTAVLGDTCGEWQTSPTGSADRKRLNVECGGGLTCVGWLAVYPEGQIGNHFGRCLPAAAEECGAGSVCPNDLTCLVGASAPPPGDCFVRCTKHQDCPGPFQICASGGCQFGTCSPPGHTPEVGCRTGAHCEQSICVPDDAS